MGSHRFLKRLSADQKGVLRMAYGRLLAKDDLSFAEILRSLFQCKPKKSVPTR